MLSDRSKKWFVGIGIFVLLCITVMGLFIPHKFRDIEISEINKYKVIWAFWGIAQIILTITLTYLTISLFSKNVVSKAEYYAQLVMMLCITVMWLSIVLPSPISVLRKKEKIVYVKVAEMGKDKSVHGCKCDKIDILSKASKIWEILTKR